MPSKPHTLAVGLTGGIASGKSTVASVFAKLGARVISADDGAKALLAADPRIVRKVRRLLGPRAYGPDGVPDRAYIASRIFSSESDRKAMNAIVHPAVIAGQKKAIAAEKRRRAVPMVVVEAALIFEAGMEGLFDLIVVVDSPVRDRVARIVARNGVPRAEALRRIRSQSRSSAKASRADIVIRNRGDLRSLRRAARFVFRLIAGPGRA